MSFHPGTGLVYIPAQENLFPYIPDAKYQYRQGNWNLGVMPPPTADAPPPTVGHLVAWDPVEQKERWRVSYKAMWNSGTLSTAGNLVFQGTFDGRFVAYSADKGEKVWEVVVGTGIIASPVTYMVDNTQYVSVLAGWGGAGSLIGLGSSHGSQPVPGRLLTFALNGKAVMPVIKNNDAPPSPISFDGKPEMVQAGMLLYAQWCSVCHGIAAMGGGTLPDLRYSSPAVFDSYREIVLDGKMSATGMPSLKQWVKPEEIDLIKAFILSQRAKIAK
jgi:quinohemoprotein ethanol dehydrogenase